MPRAGYCAECGTHIWLDAQGGCANGHSAECVSDVYEAEPQPAAADLTEGEQTAESQAVGLLGRTRKSASHAEIELSEAQSEYKQATKAAEKNLKAATKSWDKALKEAERSLAEAQKFGTKKLGSYGGLVLYEHAVVTPQGTINLEAEPAVASVDSAGNLMQTRRSTLTRMATGGVLLGPAGLFAGGMMKKKGKFDTRELYLVVESASVASLIQCRPDDGPKVRQLANAINMASRGAPTRGAQRAQVVPQWEQHVQGVRTQRDAAIAEAVGALEAARNNTLRADQARAALQQPQSQG